MTSTQETQMSLYSHNKCGKITIKHWELDLFFNFIFYFIWRGGVHTHPTHPPCPRACRPYTERTCLAVGRTHYLVTFYSDCAHESVRHGICWVLHLFRSNEALIVQNRADDVELALWCVLSACTYSRVLRTSRRRKVDENCSRALAFFPYCEYNSVPAN